MKTTEPEGHFNTEFNVKDTSKAQTKDATDYFFKRKDKNRVCIIDTPGLNDTEGLTQDDKNLDTILNAAMCSPRLSGIILIINGSSARITHNIRSMITKLKGSLPDSMMNNIIVVFTMCREGTCNFRDLKQLGINPKNVFYINNTAFSEDPTKWNNNEKMHLTLEWNESMQVCQNLQNAMDAIEPIATDEFVKIKTLRSDIKSALHQIRMELSNLQKVTDHIATIEINKQLADTTAELNKEFTTQQTITVNEMVTVNYHSTICPKCNWVCHDHCGLEFQGTPGAHFEHCCAMDANNNCNQCPEKCPASQHYHDNKSMQPVTKNVDKIIKDMQDKYLSSLDDAQKYDAELNQQSLLKNSIDKQIQDYMNDIENKCRHLKSICSHFNIVDELNELIYQLRKEAQTLTSLEARQIADETIKNIEDMCKRFDN